MQSHYEQLKQQSLDTPLTPEGFSIPLPTLRTEQALFLEAILPLLNEEENLSSQYMQVNGAQMVTWEGKEISTTSLRRVLFGPERQRREQAWRRMNERQLMDRERLHGLWVKGIQVRQEIAHNAGYDTYRDYRWQQLFRFDYTPADCQRFHEAVEQGIGPVPTRLSEKRPTILTLAPPDPLQPLVNPHAIL